MERYRLRSLKRDKDIVLTLLFYLVPGLVLMLLFQLWHILRALYYSFLKVNLMSGKKESVGLKNYIDAFSDRIFLRSIWTTFKYFLMRVPLQIVLGFLLALLVVKKTKFSGFMRTVILIPVITSMVVVTAVFGLMFHPSNGLINGILSWFGIPAQGFLTDERQALWSIAYMTIWKNVGRTMLFFLAGLMGIPESLYEAASIDGANTIQKHVYVTIPMLGPTFAFVFLTTTINSFQVFGPVLMTTGGGPANSTNVIVMHIYQNAFVYNQVGYASALSIIFASMLIVVSLIQNVLKRRLEK